MPPTLGLDLGGPSPAPVDGRLVEVAVDAPAGPGPRTYTYLAPAGLGDLEPGEAVLVPFGRGGRQAIGIVVGEGTAPDGGGIRPIAARVRSDGPLLPALSLAFAAELSARYLAPLAVVIRAMLPPGMLERLELMAEVTPAGEARMGLESPGLPPPELDLLDELAGRARAVRDLSSPEGRAALLRRLRALADGGPGRADVDAAGRGRRPALRAAAVGHGRGPGHGPGAGGGRASPGTTPGTPPEGGARGAGVAGAVPAGGRAGGAGRRAPRLVVPRRPRPPRPPARRGARASTPAPREPPRPDPWRAPGGVLADGGPGRGAPAGAGRAGRRRPHADPARRGHRRRQDRDLRGGHRRVAGCRPAGAPAGPRDRAGDAHRGPAAGGPRGPGRRHALRAGRGGARRRVAPDPRGRGGPRRRDPDGPAGAAGGRRADRRGRGARRGLQERPDAAVPGPRRGAGARPARGCRRGPRLGDAGRGDDGSRPLGAVPAGRAAGPRGRDGAGGHGRGHARGAGRGQPGPDLGRPGRGPGGAATRSGATGRSSS